MNDSLINAVSLYMQGETTTLTSLAGGIAKANPTSEDFEASAVLLYTQKAVTAVRKTMPLDHSIIGFDGAHIIIQCKNPNHPHQAVPVHGNSAWLRGPKNSDAVVPDFPSLFAVNPALKIKRCSMCEEETKNPLIEYRPVCRAHQCILPASMECPQCKEGPSLFALDGRSITLVRREPTAAVYECPMHSIYSVGHRAKNHGCPHCAEYANIVTYGSTLKRTDWDALKRLKDATYTTVRKYLRKAAYHTSLGPQKIAMIRDLTLRCFDYQNNMHLLHIFPSQSFIEGAWLVDHTKHFAFSDSNQEYLMPHPQDLIDPVGEQFAVLMDEANVACDSQWRTAHYMRHKELI